MTPELRERLEMAVERTFEASMVAWLRKWVGPAGIADEAPDPPEKDDVEAADIVNAILTELTAAGYAVVPREPTEEMVEAAKATEGSKALDVICVFGHNHGHKLPHFETTPLIQMWQAMLAAEDQT